MIPTGNVISRTLPRPGWGGEVPRFTDMQWYMYHSQNVAHFAAFATGALDARSARNLARALLDRAPQLATGYPGALQGEPVPDDVLDRIVRMETVDGFDAFPQAGLNHEDDLLTATGLPLFRLSVAVRSGGADEAGRAAYVQVRVCHALVEGLDSALLTRSQSSAHQPISRLPEPPRRVWPEIVGNLAALGHLVAGNLYVPHPGPFHHAVRTLDRRRIGRLARRLGVRQRTLLFALALALLFDQGSQKGKNKVSCTYSTIDNHSVTRDPFMRMRMLFTTFANRSDFAGLINAVDAGLTRAETTESGFAAAMNAAALRAHRRMARVLRFAYTPRLFQFMPFDLIIGLIPPHRLKGSLTNGLVEPVYAGAGTPGGNGCVFVPNRDRFTVNFYLQERLLPRLENLEVLLSEIEDTAP